MIILMSISGILRSCVGYDHKDPVRLVLRSDDGLVVRADAGWRVVDGHGSVITSGRWAAWGECWHSHWWQAEVGPLAPGSYRLEPLGVDGWLHGTSHPFVVGEDHLWQATWRTVALDQLDSRIRKPPGGWLDCGSHWREANSTAAQIIGLVDALDHRGNELAEADAGRLRAHVMIGCDYLAQCQDAAEGGALMHNLPWVYTPAPGLAIPPARSDAPKAACAWAGAAAILDRHQPDKASDYRRRARLALDWFARTPPTQAGFVANIHGAPDGFLPSESMTCDLLMCLDARVRLGDQDPAIALADEIMARQIRPDQAEDGLHGHFRTFASASFSEKAWIHHGGPLHDGGGTFPLHLFGFLGLLQRWGDHPRASAWRRTLDAAAFGYLLPACRANPFGLLPLGWFPGQGLIWFAGLWHGMNAAYGFAAALALDLHRLSGERGLREVAVGNLQWIAGLHAGLIAGCDLGCRVEVLHIPDGRAESASMIHRVGDRSAGTWLNIPGSICNGFATGRQFKLDVPPERAHDAPSSFTDEDWITHSGAWLSATARLKDQRR